MRCAALAWQGGVAIVARSGERPSPLSNSLKPIPNGRVARGVAANIEQSWQEIKVVLRDRVGEPTYGLWLAPLRCVGLDGDTLVLAGPAEVSAWASSRFSGALREASATVLGREVTVAVESEGTEPATRSPPSVAADALPGKPLEPNPKY